MEPACPRSRAMEGWILVDSAAEELGDAAGGAVEELGGGVVGAGAAKELGAAAPPENRSSGLQSPTHRLLFFPLFCSCSSRLPVADSPQRFSVAVVVLVRSLVSACMGLDVAEIGMGLDLGLDLRLFAARSAGGMAAAAAKGAPAGIQACIRSLEEERRKIEVFKRELPLCVRLLADVIEELKEEAARKNGDLEMKADDGDKKKWMSTAQLWVDSDAKSKCEKEHRSSEMTSPEPKLLDGPMPIRAVPAVPSPPPCFGRDDNAAGTVGLTGLSLLPSSGKASLTPAPAAVDEHRQNITARFSANMPPSSPASGLNLHVQSQQQQSRKARRCWSPELHRQFVAALHQLGGPQVATPKQIREVMQVDGLTNDEVKSHLQKYRLHNRRSPGVAPVSQSIMLVGGGLWVPQEQSSSQSGSPQGPLQFSGSGVAISAATVGGDSSSSSDEDDKSDEGYSRK